MTRVTLIGLGHTGHKGPTGHAESHKSHRLGHKTELEFIYDQTDHAGWRPVIEGETGND